ncbi:hypothetical protein OQA88_1115 [Cercophora sp. LCS_1]
MSRISAAAGTWMLAMLLFSGQVRAEDDIQFGFDLFSDIAPILALFGEQFARQFMSESMTWVDHLIFSLVPLGIITVITGAIRVSGPPVTRSFIGRARENRAQAEIELMSSTSKEVCELFNGDSIVRAMGKPKITEFLIFPEEYNRLEKEYEKQDQSQRQRAAPEPPDGLRDDSCGVHSLESARGATRIETEGEHLMEYGAMPPLARRFESLTPPNLQLNLSSNHFTGSRVKKHHELFLAALIAVLLQAGPITIPVVTMYHPPTREALGSFQPWGVPCYVAGSALLSLGIGICSRSVERSTVEKVYNIPKKWRRSRAKKTHSVDLASCPRLLWLQQNQTVNDQAFDGYAILAGPKRRIVTSRRGDDIDSSIKQEKNLDPAVSGSSEGNHVTNRLVGSAREASRPTASAAWQILTVVGVFASGIGFIAQFVGLRGLAFPCSVAHLGAIFIMALVRAGIRRRLGRIPAHCPALPKYELDFLATHITFVPGFRNFHQSDSARDPTPAEDSTPTKGSTPPEDLYTGETPASHFYQWAVAAPDRGRKDLPFYFVVPSDLGNNSREYTSSSPSSTPPKRLGPKFQSASSQQLLRPSQASESAIALAQSVELFLDTFIPWHDDSSSPKSQLNTLNWMIQTVNPSRSSVESPASPDFISISVKRMRGQKWKVSDGELEAALSLWMATIESKSSEKSEKSGKSSGGSATGPFAGVASNWRREQAKAGVAQSFFRILGDDFQDGALRRDLAWWVDELVAEQSKPQSKSEGNDIDLVIGFSGRPATSDARREEDDEKSGREEFGILSRGFLPTILAQHLFTNFMWNIASHLPDDYLRSGYTSSQRDVEIEASDSFNPDRFSETWQRPKLRHRMLSKVVRQMESNGLGSTIDILLCMVPALSFHDRLPNVAMLKILPEVGPSQGWVETAHCYNQLLKSSMRSQGDLKERFYYAVVSIQPPEDLLAELQSLIEQLTSPTGRFASTVRKLGPIYNIQRRRKSFGAIFRRFGLGYKAADSVAAFEDDTAKLDHEFLKKALGDYPIESDGPTTPDIFGWTPIHYGFLTNNKIVGHFMIHYIQEAKKALRVHKLLDNLGRSPLHAAATTKTISIDFVGLFGDSGQEDEKMALSGRGRDGMTPLHLAVKSENMVIFQYITRQGLLRDISERDIWGREAIHIAASRGSPGVANELLRVGSLPDRVDGTGKSPIDYLLHSKPDDEYDGQDTGSGGGTPGLSSSNVAPMSQGRLEDKRCDILQQFASSKPDYRDPAGKTFLHIAAGVANVETIKKLISIVKVAIDEQDSQQRTALHCALLTRNEAVAITLISEFNSSLSAKDSNGRSVLMLAVSGDMLKVVTRFLSQAKTHQHPQPKERPTTPVEVEDGGEPVAICDVNGRDSDGRTALHYAVAGEPLSDGPSLIKLLVSEGCDASARDSDGLTTLHLALRRKEQEAVVSYFFSLEELPQIQRDPTDKNGESLLITACRSNSIFAIEPILKLWPDIINRSDAESGQSPLSWACEGGRKEILRELLKHPRIDVNNPARGYMRYAPLHFAVVETGDGNEMLGWLLAKEEIDVDAKSGLDETPLQLAMNRGKLLSAKRLLLHSKTSDETRFNFLGEAIRQELSVPQDMLQEVFEHIRGESVTAGKLQDLLTVAQLARQTRRETLFRLFMSKAVTLGVWKDIPNPHHQAAKVEDIEIVRRLTKAGGDPAQLDQDNWSCFDYATRLKCSDGFISALRAHINDHKPEIEPSTQAFRKPTKLQDWMWVCIRSDHPIPPPTNKKDEYFYFEVTITENSGSRIFGLGFCGPDGGENRMPGWFESSWAYHGDGGNPFIESGFHTEPPSQDFGTQGQFGAGDTVGVYFNLKTGEAFCTLNGNKMDMGSPPLKLEELTKGKVHPCVGLDVTGAGVGLAFTVNFGRSPEKHPFLYNGFLESRLVSDDSDRSPATLSCLARLIERLCRTKPGDDSREIARQVDLEAGPARRDGA